ncbi:exodeoxyribonuclease VII large subunit [Desulfitispora alkaliphila]|uniref:exodeoxyribonuclease VII large subunit n=1 Tax=Desulfitispora alkaliphila TaxID=622674 RepID=UPI003D1E1957
MQINVITIRELSEYVKVMLDNEPRLQQMWVKGEISNFKHHSSGHMYFTLKDEYSSIKAVMFKGKNWNLNFIPKNGMSVIVRGSVSLYIKGGQYQLYVEEMQPEGQGSLYIALEKLKEQLNKKGYFDLSIKKEIPILPSKIGIVTSPTSAALRDILKVINRRYPNYPVIISPTAVQGDDAPKQIAKAINNLNKLGSVDVIIVARGGGSLEELWAFNAEEVATAIYNSQIPIVSGVGHEVDYTISDLVADKRAATPSAAAEMVVPVKAEMIEKVNLKKERLKQALINKLQQKKEHLYYLRNSSVLTNPKASLNQYYQQVDYLERDLLNNISRVMKDVRSNYSLCANKLELLSPLKVLSRGYSICQDKKTKEIITDSDQVTGEQLLELNLYKGRIDVVADKIQEGDNE